LSSKIPKKQAKFHSGSTTTQFDAATKRLYLTDFAIDFTRGELKIARRKVRKDYKIGEI